MFRDTDALNTNLELRFGSGGDGFRGGVRWVHADADRESKALTIAQQTDTQCFPTTQAQADTIDPVTGQPSCTTINPTAIPANLAYSISNGIGDEQMNYVISEQLRNLAANPAAWRVHSSWLERNFTESDMNVLRFDGTFGDTDGLNSRVWSPCLRT